MCYIGSCNYTQTGGKLPKKQISRVFVTCQYRYYALSLQILVQCQNCIWRFFLRKYKKYWWSWSHFQKHIIFPRAAFAWTSIKFPSPANFCMLPLSHSPPFLSWESTSFRQMIYLQRLEPINIPNQTPIAIFSLSLWTFLPSAEC